MFSQNGLKIIASNLMNGAVLDLCSDANGTVISGTNYEPVRITFDPNATNKMFGYDSTNDRIYNFFDIWFPDAESNWGTVSHVKISKTTNNVTEVYFIGALTSSINVVTGDRIRFNAGDFKISFTQTNSNNNS